MAGLLLNLARTVGLAATCAAMVLYGVAFVGQPTWPVAVMIVLALVAVWASLAVRPFVLCAAFVVSFFPIVLCDVLYLVAAGLMLVARGYQGTRSSRT